MAEENKKIVGFKKFSDIKSKSKIEEVNPSLDAQPMTDSDLPANPNLSKDSKKIERPTSRKNLIPQDQTVDLPSDEDEFENDIEETGEKTHEGKVDFTGKVAKFPIILKLLKLITSLKMLRFLRNLFGTLWLKNKTTNFKWLNITLKKVLICLNLLMN